MGIIPDKVLEQLSFYNLHAPTWEANAAAIGITPAMASVFAAAATLAQEEYNTQQDAKDAATHQTAKMRAALSDARTKAAGIIAEVKAFAENSADPAAVYALANIPAPAEPTPMAPPGQPTNLTVTLAPTSGELTLRWKCVNPPGAAGTAYIVKRRVAGGDWQFVGVTGTKVFVDSTFDAGPDSVEYTVQGQRSDSAGPVSNVFVINFGKSGPGLTISSATETVGKLAA